VRKNPTIRNQVDGKDVELQGIFDGIDTSSLAMVKEAIEKKDALGFEKNYKIMLESCYACHKSSVPDCIVRLEGVFVTSYRSSRRLLGREPGSGRVATMARNHNANQSHFRLLFIGRLRETSNITQFGVITGRYAHLGERGQH
jgi:hypothetical protein